MAGAYDSFTTTMGLGSLTADINGDGRLELLSAGVVGTNWQAIGYVPRNKDYEIVQSARLPYPFALGEGGSGVLSLGSLSPGGAPKIFSNTPLRIYDAATQKLELVSDTSLGEGRLHFDLTAAYELLGMTGALYQWQGTGWTKNADLQIQSDFVVAVASGDLNGDGFDDFVYETNGTQLQAYDFAHHKMLWQITATSMAGTSTNDIRAITIADANGDGKPDVLVVTDGAANDPGEVRASDGRTGKELWSFQHPDIVGGAIVVGNFDDDPAAEIIFSTTRPVTGPSRIWVYDLATLLPHRQMHRVRRVSP